jgi:sigma-B regulation protein RsbU (phosphoserine phosphatase)
MVMDMVMDDAQDKSAKVDASHMIGGSYSMRILIAEDGEATRLILSRLLQAWGHEVIAARDGVEAWHILQQGEVSFLITDWMMPNMDGPELCNMIRASDFSRYIYIILLTSKDEKTDLIAGMAAGADDFLIKPFNADELQLRIRAGERILDLERTLEERNRKLEEAYRHLENAYSRMRRDLEAAAEMQQSLLPQAAITLCGVKFEWLFRPCTFVAGDIFNFFRLDEAHLGFYHLDVAGHGIPSALLSVTLSKVLSPDPNQGTPLKHFIPTPPHYEITPPHQAVGQLNHRFQGDMDKMVYFTMVYGIFDSLSHQLTLTQAGHPSPVYLRNGGSPLLLGSGGFPVGMLPEVEYEPLSITLHPGDRLFLYSDGITECTNTNMEPFTDARFMEFIAASAHMPLDKVIDDLEEELIKWRGGEEFDDDISLLALEIN